LSLNPELDPASTHSLTELIPQPGARPSVYTKLDGAYPSTQS
jgi:hypothetical protein